jgi:beta-glucanase (GH16 family)
MHIRKLTISTFIISGILSSAALAKPPEGYKLKWADEFAKAGLPDANNWNYDTEANATGWYNNELQYYAARRPQNAFVSNGALTITALKERLSSMADYGGQDYTSARLISRGKFAFTYGFVEVRAKLPCKKGMWPAIWMLGANGDWPAAGEIDIMEHVSTTPGVIYGTIHSASTAGTDGNGGSVRMASACQNFNLYQMLWTKDYISIGVNGKFFHKVLNSGKGNAQWPFNKPQYLLLNLAVGGDWPGPPEDASFPSQFIIDYVRVYQRN